MPPASAPRTAGEAWTREQLAALRAARFAPGAVVCFLAASQRRAGEVRRARPALARQARRWMAAGAAAWLALGAAGAQPWRRRRRSGLAWWGAVALMLDWHLGMVETPDGRPRPLGPADGATLLRVWLVPVAADDPTPAVVALAAASDLLDGRLARAGAPTRIGRDLEGLADTCFAVAALRGLRRRGRLGRGAAGAELVRQTAGFAYALTVYFGTAAAPDPAVRRAARLTTPLRAGGLLAGALGRRRLADALVASGCAVGVGSVLCGHGMREHAPR